MEQARIERGFDFRLPTLRPKRIRQNQSEDIAQQTLDFPVTSDGSSFRGVSTVTEDDVVTEPPKKIRRVKIEKSDLGITTSGLKITIPARNRGRPRKTRLPKNSATTEGACRRRSPREFKEDFQQQFDLPAARKSRSVRREDVPPIASTSKAYLSRAFHSNVDHEERWTAPSNSGWAFSTLAVPSSSSGIDRKYDDGRMSLCDPILVSSGQDVPCSWPESRTGLPPIWSKVRHPAYFRCDR